jgi:hypothetical protein
MRKAVAKIVLGISMFSFMLILGGCDLFETIPDAPYISGTFSAYLTTLTWSSVYGAKEYIIYSGPYPGSSNPATFTRVYTTTITTWNEATTLARYYAVKASNSRGESGFSNVIYTY